MSTIFFHIDEMKESDLPAVRYLAEQLGYSAEIVDLARRFYALTKSQDHKLFVARNGDQQAVGWVHVGKEMASLIALMTAQALELWLSTLKREAVELERA